MSETVVAEGVVRVDKSLIMELWICCGKGVGITLCVHSFSMAYPQRNGTYPRCSRPFEDDQGIECIGRIYSFLFTHRGISAQVFLQTPYAISSFREVAVVGNLF